VVRSGIFVVGNARYDAAVRRVLQRMPGMVGKPVRLEHAPGLRDRRGAVHAGSFLRERRIAFDCTGAEFPRIFAHEAAHFVWLRLGNPMRREWEMVVRAEIRRRISGELGWSAEWRKEALRAGDWKQRSRRWREYCCEAFCDTAAWLWSGVGRHPEFTLAGNPRAVRRKWFRERLGGRRLSI
jgi:hypothetical protein